jgi:hypothetical protein
MFLTFAIAMAAVGRAWTGATLEIVRARRFFAAFTNNARQQVTTAKPFSVPRLPRSRLRVGETKLRVCLPRRFRSSLAGAPLRSGSACPVRHGGGLNRRHRAMPVACPM